MKVHELPDDIFTNHNQPGDEIVFYHYSSIKDSFREKSILKQNAFSLVINGSKTMHFAEKTVHIQDREIHLLSAGNCIASITISNHKPFESVLIFFDDRVLRDFYLTHGHNVSTTKRSTKETKAYVEFKKDEFIRHFIQSILLTLRHKKRLSASMKCLKLQELLLYLLENEPDKLLSFTSTHPTTDIELKIRKVVESNAENNLTLDELAFLCNVSVSTFKRHFKKLYNSSPIEWSHRQRMILAGKMLVHEKPSDVWYKLGFETHTGFTKSFKKHYGVLPKDFANKLT